MVKAGTLTHYSQCFLMLLVQRVDANIFHAFQSSHKEIYHLQIAFSFEFSLAYFVMFVLNIIMLRQVNLITSTFKSMPGNIFEMQCYTFQQKK
jgi:hypothetical protein